MARSLAFLGEPCQGECGLSTCLVAGFTTGSPGEITRKFTIAGECHLHGFFSLAMNAVASALAQREITPGEAETIAGVVDTFGWSDRNNR